MKICFITENGVNGKIPRDYPHARTEFAWMIALEATHYNLNYVLKNTISEKFDIAVLIPPKNVNLGVNILGIIRKFAGVVSIMQEGPSWYYQDKENIADQINFILLLQAADFVFCHNESDKLYYKTFVERVHVLPSLIIEDSIKHLMQNPPKERSNIMLGGNFSSWYGGMDSYLAALRILLDGEHLMLPSMGRSANGEEAYIKKLPHMQWNQWMEELSNFRIGVHLMRTSAAGTFSLNCAALGIPCIGYSTMDTQIICHPSTSYNTIYDCNVSLQSIFNNVSREDSRIICKELGSRAKANYNEFFSEEIFISKIKSILNEYL